MTYSLQNKNIKAIISTFGATIQNLYINDVDIVLGYECDDDYAKYSSNQGATIGRYANRIAKGRFAINEKDYTLNCNDGENHLHGGIKGFNKQIWNVKSVDENHITLSYLSLDGEEGYPGNLLVQVTFSLDDSNFTIEYVAKTDKDTICNLTNHAYFNLDGFGSGPILNTFLKINSDYISEIDDGLIPTGKLLNVRDTPFDFHNFKKIGRDINSKDAQLKIQGGYDCNYILKDRTFAAQAYSEKSGISMTIFTDMPALQLYTGNFLDGTEIGKKNIPLRHREGFCLETQFPPNSPNFANHGGCLLKANETFNKKTIIRFILNAD